MLLFAQMKPVEPLTGFPQKVNKIPMHVSTSLEDKSVQTTE